MQATGSRVGATPELATRVQFGHDEFNPGELGLGFLVDGNAPSVVGHQDRTTDFQDHLDLRAVPGKGFVNGVVHDLPQAVHEAAGVVAADVHARALTNSVQALQDRKVPG